MTAYSRLTTGLLFGLLAACATVPEANRSFDIEFDQTEPVGLVSGYAVDQRLRGMPTCAEGYICIDAVFEIELEDAELLAGATGAPISTMWVVQHGEAPGDPPRMVFVAQKARDGRLWAHDLALVRGGNACLAQWSWQNYRELIERAGGGLVDGDPCIPMSE